MNRRTIEALIAVPGLISIDDHPARLLSPRWSCHRLGRAGGSATRCRPVSSTWGVAEVHAPQRWEVPRWREKQQLAEERQRSASCFSGHPFNAVKGARSGVSYGGRSTSSNPRARLQLLAGLVTATRTKLTARGKMAFVTLDDGTEPQEVAVSTRCSETEKGKLREDEVLIIEGKVSKDDFDGDKVRVTAERIMTLADARSRTRTALVS